MPAKIAFAGTPELAATILDSLIGTGMRPCAVFTQPDRPAGRGRRLTASPVKMLAGQHGIAVHQPVSLRGDGTQRLIEGLDLDLMVVAAYGLLLPPRVLNAPRLGCVNVHASILPRWRGAAPIQRAILAGDSESGVTLMQMEAGLDTGPVLAVATCRVSPEDTAATLHDRIASLGAATLIENLPRLLRHELVAVPQDDSRSTYAERIDKQDAEIDWQQSAVQIERAVRAFNPWPVAYTRPASGDPVRLRVWAAQVPAAGPGGLPAAPDRMLAAPGRVLAAPPGRLWVATGDGTLEIQTLQAPGGKALPVRQFLNARHLPPGTRFLAPGQAVDGPVGSRAD